MENDNPIEIAEDEDSDILCEAKDIQPLGNGTGTPDVNDTKNTTQENPTLYSTNIEYSPITKEYSQKNTIYNVNAFEIWKTGENKTKKPIEGQIKLIVHTGSTSKTYTQNLANGETSFKLPKLAVGKHTVEIFVNGEKRATTYIKIVKATAKVTAPSAYAKFKKKNYFKITVTDRKGNPVKKITLKVKVYTGKKAKTYKIKTNSKGIAKLQTKGLSLGTHKIKITSGNKYYTIKKTTKVIVKKTSKSVKVLVDNKMLKKHKKFYVKALNIFGNPVKKVSLNVKVFTGKKAKTYKVKTNAKGVAKVSAKLSLGTHKVSVKTKDKNYIINKNAKIKVVSKLSAPKLVSLKYYEDEDGEYHVKLTWKSQKSAGYQVLKKTNGNYKVVSTVTGSKKTTSFTHKVGHMCYNTYSVREIINKNNGRKVLGSCDQEGLKPLDRPNVKVDFQNLKANITWDRIEGATNYLVFRKIGHDGEYKCIATLDSNTFTYEDVYYKSADELKKILNSETFVDPSFNSLFYTVRACNVTDSGKTSYGLYYLDGDFHLEAPSIVYLKDNTITWGKVPNAEGYIILQKINGMWKEIKRAESFKTTTFTLALNGIDKNSYYSVQAYAHKNGAFAYSDFDEGFTLKDYSASNALQRILFFGDSITYGSPYKSEASRHIFSIPHRVAQLLGCTFFNPSIPGSTYHDLGQINGKNVENGDYYRYRITREVVDPIYDGGLPGNWESLDSAKNSEGRTNTRLDEYNIVVLAAGTNDYLDNSELGGNESNDTSTFNGAFNHIMEKIDNASKARVDKGLDPIKVIFVDLYYSDRTEDIRVRTNRDITPNDIGLTLMDYQKALDAQYNKWMNQTKGNLTFYNFKTRDYNIANEENSPYTASDNLHFTKFTYGQYGNAFARFLVENVF